MGCWSLLESSGRTGSRSPAVATASPSTTFRSPRLYQEEVASASSSTVPAAAPHRTLCSASILLDPSTGDRDVAHEGSQPCPGEQHLGPSCLTIKAGPFCAESLPARQHHQSSIRHGTKMGHTPSVRAGYSSTPLPQPHRVPVRAKPGPPLQLVVSDPLSTQTQGGRPRNAALPREKGCCWSAIHGSCQA